MDVVETAPAAREAETVAVGALGPFLRFVGVGPVGILLGAAQYELLWRLLPADGARAGVAWLASSALGVLWIHALHCRFTFRARRGSWRATVVRAYGVYGLSIGLGTLGMHALVDVGRLPRGPAWIATTAAASLLNFALLRRLVSGATATGVPR